ncbi:hypothetical protein BDP55DRAFT_655533 [Colletotrichum godetiae]|uniref:Uncharacterized protein n=1 Tax=Colletotrichum godetiae TaxID=1209918 RepID=A0AAJ0AR80_9PEZI|nr:uncharacterized protein BDP55DRAFT_655533 [Colletotrichum godetiae]KAK1688890.1 hypothetical protein BDP55DRAFT_655533 [Colletotrichum godetiae]
MLLTGSWTSLFSLFFFRRRRLQVPRAAITAASGMPTPSLTLSVRDSPILGAGSAVLVLEAKVPEVVVAGLLEVVSELDEDVVVAAVVLAEVVEVGADSSIVPLVSR